MKTKKENGCLYGGCAEYTYENSFGCPLNLKTRHGDDEKGLGPAGKGIRCWLPNTYTYDIPCRRYCPLICRSMILELMRRLLLMTFSTRSSRGGMMLLEVHLLAMQQACSRRGRRVVIGKKHN